MCPWAQSSTAIVYAYLRLGQRGLDRATDARTLLRLGGPALAWSTLSLAGVLVLAGLDVVPRWLFVPYAVQWLETLYGVARPAIALKPTQIGWRQLSLSTAFTILFVVTWRA